jgi:hypothetical protein
LPKVSSQLLPKRDSSGKNFFSPDNFFCGDCGRAGRIAQNAGAGAQPRPKINGKQRVWGNHVCQSGAARWFWGARGFAEEIPDFFLPNAKMAPQAL